MIKFNQFLQTKEDAYTLMEAYVDASLSGRLSRLLETI